MEKFAGAFDSKRIAQPCSIVYRKWNRCKIALLVVGLMIANPQPPACSAFVLTSKLFRPVEMGSWIAAFPRRSCHRWQQTKRNAQVFRLAAAMEKDDIQNMRASAIKEELFKRGISYQGDRWGFPACVARKKSISACIISCLRHICARNMLSEARCCVSDYLIDLLKCVTCPLHVYDPHHQHRVSMTASALVSAPVCTGACIVVSVHAISLLVLKTRVPSGRAV